MPMYYLNGKVSPYLEFYLHSNEFSLSFFGVSTFPLGGSIKCILAQDQGKRRRSSKPGDRKPGSGLDTGATLLSDLGQATPSLRASVCSSVKLTE